MSDSKPKIYGFCAAGCKWETVHKDDFQNAATWVKQYPSTEGIFLDLPIKNKYKIVSPISSDAYSCAIALIYYKPLATLPSVYQFSITEFDEYRNYFYFEILSIDVFTATVVYEVNGNRHTVQLTEEIPITDITLRITGATEVLAFNSDACIEIVQEGQGSQGNNTDILNSVYPVGSIYMSVVNVSPASFIGGTWERIQDKFLLSAGNTYSAGSEGGEAAHTLTIDEIPSHNHATNGAVLNTDYWATATGSSVDGWVKNTAGTAQGAAIYSSSATGKAGGGEAHNNMPPYLTVYMWVRVADEDEGDGGTGDDESSNTEYYTLTFTSDGHTETVPANVSAGNVTGATLPSATASSGYEFLSWKIDGDESGTAYNAGTKFIPTTDVTFVAQTQATPSTFTGVAFTDMHETALTTEFKTLSDSYHNIYLGDFIHSAMNSDGSTTPVATKITTYWNMFDKYNRIPVVRGNHDNDTNYNETYSYAGYIPYTTLQSSITRYGGKPLFLDGGSIWSSDDYEKMPSDLKYILVDTSDYDLIHGASGEYTDSQNWGCTWNNVAHIMPSQLAKIAESLNNIGKGESVIVMGHYGLGHFGTWALGAKGANGENVCFSTKPLAILLDAYVNRKAGVIKYSEIECGRDFAEAYDPNSTETFNNWKNATVFVPSNTSGASNYIETTITEEVDRTGEVAYDFTHAQGELIGYFHGHSHNHDCNRAYKWNNGVKEYLSFLEIGFPSLTTGRSTKGEGTFVNTSAEHPYDGGVYSYYGQSDNTSYNSGKDTGASMCTLFTVDRANKIITCVDKSSLSTNNGYKRTFCYKKDNLTLTKG